LRRDFLSGRFNVRLGRFSNFPATWRLKFQLIRESFERDPELPVKTKRFNRRQFLQSSMTVTGALMLSPGALADAAKRTAVDQVTLGQTGIKLSRLGMGTGSNSGHIQYDLGRQNFNDLIKYAYDQGITYFDCAETYKTFEWLGGAIKGLPREKLFIQSKIPGQPDDVLAVIDNHRKVFNTDFVDSMLIHCMVKDGWTDQWKRVMDGFNEAKEKRLDSQQGRLMPQPARPARSDGHALGRSAFGARQSAGAAHGRTGGSGLAESGPGPSGRTCVEPDPNHARERPRHHRHENYRQR
jgi:Aldo/keto reductase family